MSKLRESLLPQSKLRECVLAESKLRESVLPRSMRRESVLPWSNLRESASNLRQSVVCAGTTVFLCWRHSIPVAEAFVFPCRRHSIPILGDTQYSSAGTIVFQRWGHFIPVWDHSILCWDYSIPVSEDTVFLPWGDSSLVLGSQNPLDCSSKFPMGCNHLHGWSCVGPGRRADV